MADHSVPRQVKPVWAAKSKNSPAEASAGGGLQIDPKQMMLAIRDRWLSATSLALLVCTLLGFWLFQQPKEYRATSQLLVKHGERVLGEQFQKVQDDSVGGGQNDPIFNTHLQQILNREMMYRVVASFTNEEQDAILAPYLDGPILDRERNGRLAGLVRGGLSAYRRGTTYLIDIASEHRDPRMAALIATRVAETYVVYLLERSNSVNDSAVGFLNKQTEALRLKAEASEQALQEYRQKSGLVSLEDSQNIVVDKMKAVSVALTQAEINRLSLESSLQQAENVMKNHGDPLQLASITEFSSLASIQAQLDELHSRKVTLAEKYGRKHPAMLEIESSKAALEKLRDELVETAIANLRNRRDKALANEEQLREQLSKSEEASLKLDKMSIQYNALRRLAESDRSTYAQVLSRLKETSLTSQLQDSSISIAERATIPGLPFKPDSKKITMMLVLVGLMIVVGYPVAIELISNRVKSWSDVENYLGQSVLAELPLMNKIEARLRPHLLSNNKDEDAAETIRSLYAQLKLTSRLDAPKTLMVTSTVPSEGKSFVAVNLATAFAQHKFRTLIIDGDWRRPTLHRSFELKNQHGMLHWLDQGGELKGPLVEDPHLDIKEMSPGLFVLRAGGSTRSTNELLDDKRMTTLLTEARKQFDIVIIDTPPSGIFPDALAFADFAHELVYVTRFNHVARPIVRRTIQRLLETGVEPTGVVLNMMPSGRAAGSYYSGYGYYGSKQYAKYYSETPSES